MIQKKQVIFMLLQHRCSYCTWPLGVSVSPGSAEKLYGFSLYWFIRLEVFFSPFSSRKAHDDPVMCDVLYSCLASSHTSRTSLTLWTSGHFGSPGRALILFVLSRDAVALLETCSSRACCWLHLAAVLLRPSARPVQGGMVCCISLSLSFDCVT